MWGNVQWGRWWRTTRSCFSLNIFGPPTSDQINFNKSESTIQCQGTAQLLEHEVQVWRLPAIPLPWTLMKVSRYPSWSFLWMMLRYAYTIFGWGEGVEPIQNDNREKCKLYFQPSLLLIYLPFVRSYPCLSDSITNSCTPKVDQMETPKCLGNIMPYPIMEKSVQKSMGSQVPKRQLLGPPCHVHASRSVRGEVFHPQ